MVSFSCKGRTYESFYHNIPRQIIFPCTFFYVSLVVTFFFFSYGKGGSPGENEYTDNGKVHYPAANHKGKGKETSSGRRLFWFTKLPVSLSNTWTSRISREGSKMMKMTEGGGKKASTDRDEQARNSPTSLYFLFPRAGTLRNVHCLLLIFLLRALLDFQIKTPHDHVLMRSYTSSVVFVISLFQASLFVLNCWSLPFFFFVCV